jgi:hypothetical protein
MKRLFLFAAVILFCNAVTAQKKHSVIFNSYNSVGFVAGKLPVSFAAQTENGIKYKNWFIGAGFGIDLYYKESLLLFAAVKKEFPLKNNSSSIFLYANAGSNIIEKHKNVPGFFSSVKTQGGFYADAGAGYKIKTTKRSNIFFSVGNAVKNIKETEESIDTGFPYSYQTKRKLSRIAFKIGYQF